MDISKLLPDVKISDSDSHEHLNDDYVRTRANLFEILEEGKAALLLAMRIAEETEHPKSIEALSGLLKNLADINQQILKVHLDKKTILKRDSVKSLPGEETSGGPTTNNYIFTGTTTDLQRMIQDAKLKDVTPKD